MTDNHNEAEDNYDICLKCGLVVDMLQPHSYDRAEGRPIHRECAEDLE